MSLHRRAAKRDAAEPAIVSALEALGCVVWRVSGKGLPDLVVFYRRKNPVMGGPNQTIFVADVKGPKERATPAQVEKWTTLVNLGFSVFILRTPEDAQKMLNNALQPWEPTPPRIGKDGRKRLVDDQWDIPLPDGRRLRNKPRTGAKSGRPDYVEAYTPPRSEPVAHRSDCEQVYHKDDREPCTCGALAAAKEAEETFAPREHRLSKACLDPDKMNGAGDQFPGSDYD